MNGFDRDAFVSLQARLAPMWPTMTVRRRAEDRTLIVLSSVGMNVPPELNPLLPAYEERYLSQLGRRRGRIVLVGRERALPGDGGSGVNRRAGAVSCNPR